VAPRRATPFCRLTTSCCRHANRSCKHAFSSCRLTNPIYAPGNRIADQQLDVADTHFRFADTQCRSALPGTSLQVHNTGLRIGRPTGVTCFSSASRVRSASLHAIQLWRLSSACGIGDIAISASPGAQKSAKQRYYFSMNEVILLLDDPQMSSFFFLHIFVSIPGRFRHCGMCLGVSSDTRRKRLFSESGILRLIHPPRLFPQEVIP